MDVRILSLRFMSIIFNFSYLFLVFTACTDSNESLGLSKVYLASPDTTQLISIITSNDYRYVMDGYHDKIPKTGYILLNLSEVDPLGDAVGICWNGASKGWRFYSAYSVLMVNSLDSSMYQYKPSLGNFGEPIAGEYDKPHCGQFAIRELRSPKGNLIVLQNADL